MARNLFMTIRVSKDEKALLVKRAQDNGVEVSAFIRDALDLPGTNNHGSSAEPALKEASNEC